MKTTRRTLRRIFIFLFSFSLSLNPFVKGPSLSFLSPSSEIKSLAEKQKMNPNDKVSCFSSLTDFASQLRWIKVSQIEPILEKLESAQKEKVPKLFIQLREAYRAYHDLQLDPKITADQILEFIRKNLKKPQILDAEILFKLFPIMIRWLKKNNWSVSKDSYLRKEKIASYLFSSLSKNLKKIEILGEEESEKKENLEKLMFISFFHLFNVQDIIYPPDIFKEIIIKKVSLIGVDLAGIDSTDENRHISFLNENFSFADFRGSKLKGLQSCILIGALLSDANLALANAENADFSFADLKRTCWNGAKLDGAIFTAASLDHADFCPFEGVDEDFQPITKETSLKGAIFLDCEFKTVVGLNQTSVGSFIHSEGVSYTVITDNQRKYFSQASDDDLFIYVLPSQLIATSL